MMTKHPRLNKNKLTQSLKLIEKEMYLNVDLGTIS